MGEDVTAQVDEEALRDVRRQVVVGARQLRAQDDVADVEQRQHEPREPAAPVVPAGGGARRAQSARQILLSQVAAQQLQAAVRGQLLGRELDRQRALDHPSQARYAHTHQRGLLCVGSNVGAFSLSIAQGAFLLPIHDATQHLFSDWG